MMQLDHLSSSHLYFQVLWVKTSLGEAKDSFIQLNDSVSAYSKDLSY
jgi:hypothetical protein